MPYSSVADLPANVKKRPAKTQRQWMHVFNNAYSSCMESEGDRTACESKAFAQANGVIKGSELPTELHQAHEDIPNLQLEKSDPRVDYRVAPEGDDKICGTCRFFDALCMKCAVVEGTVDSTWKCSLWTERLSGSSMLASPMEMYREPLYQVFVEASQVFATGLDLTKPQWIPFLPKPGRFDHPKYGEVVITPGQNQEMVASFKDKVYQEHIPLDAEHETKLSGAVAWIKDLRMNDDNSADALVEWTPRGQTLVGGDNPQFKYISPEWFADWRDPATGVVHRNVVAGGAITTRPFFKDKVLRALVASEAGSQVIFNQGGSPMPEVKDKGVEPAPPNPTPTPGPTPTPPTPKTFTEDELEAEKAKAVQAAEAKLREELGGENKTFAERLTAAEQAAAAEKTAREAAEARVANLEKDKLHQRFSDLVSGRGGQNDGQAWVGDQAKHVSHLERLATTFGETDEMVTSYIEQQNAIAAQMKDSSLFSEIGSGNSAPINASEDIDKLDKMAEERFKADPKKTKAQHYSELMETSEGKAAYEADAVRKLRGRASA